MSGRLPNQPSEPPHQAVFDSQTYVQQTLQLLGLSVGLEQLPNVVENFDRIHRIAQPVLDFPLPDELEAAPTFEP